MRGRASDMGNVIALSGYKGSGKDTVAEYLVDDYGYIRISMADYLKDLVSQQYGIPRAYFDSSIWKDKPLRYYPVVTGDPFTKAVHDLLSDELQSGYWTPRALLILEGSVKRSVNLRYWIQRIVDQIRENPRKSYVVSDMRYQSEFRFLTSRIPELITVRVERFSPEEITTRDPSERDLDGVEHHVHLQNKDTLYSLYLGVDRLLIKGERAKVDKGSIYNGPRS